MQGRLPGVVPSAGSGKDAAVVALAKFSSVSSFSFLLRVVQLQPASEIIFVAGLVGLVWAYLQFTMIAAIPIISQPAGGESAPLTSSGRDSEKTARLKEIYAVIYEGADSFLTAEYTICAWFIGVFSIVILVLVSWGTGWDMARGFMTALSFLLGAITSMVRTQTRAHIHLHAHAQGRRVAVLPLSSQLTLVLLLLLFATVTIVHRRVVTSE